METKWFIGQSYWDAKPYGIMKAEFNGKILMSQKKWGLLPSSPKKWSDTNLVGDWYFVGEDTVTPCTYAEAMRYLPIEAIAS